MQPSEPPHLLQEDVGRLEVAMDEVVAVQVGQPAGSIMGDAQASLPGQGSGVGVWAWGEGWEGEEVKPYKAFRQRVPRAHYIRIVHDLGVGLQPLLPP